MIPHVRKAELADLSTLVEIEKACFDENTHVFERKHFRYILTRGTGALYVYEEGKKLCGYIQVVPNSRWNLINIESLAVIPEEQGRGISLVLLREAEHYARQRKARAIHLQTRQDDPRLKTHYEKRGYVVFAVKQDYYEDGTACFKMRKIL